MFVFVVCSSLTHSLAHSLTHFRLPAQAMEEQLDQVQLGQQLEQQVGQPRAGRDSLGRAGHGDAGPGRGQHRARHPAAGHLQRHGGQYHPSKLLQSHLRRWLSYFDRTRPRFLARPSILNKIGLGRAYNLAPGVCVCVCVSVPSNADT